MGEFADMAYDMALMYELEEGGWGRYEPYEHYKGDYSPISKPYLEGIADQGLWLTREDGRLKKIKISDMETFHIKNCIALLKANDFKALRGIYLPLFKSELEKRLKKLANFSSSD